MKFIFPQNFDFKTKFLGVFDYSNIIFNMIYDIIIFTFVYYIIPIFSIKIVVFIILCFPILLLTITGFNGQNILYVFYYIIVFYLKPKLYLYNNCK